MSFIDESLLSRLVDKFGVDVEEVSANKSRLWQKVTKEYNGITGNCHSKARLNKKWQNIKHQRKAKRKKLMDSTPDPVMDESGQDDSKKFSYVEIGDNVWNVMDHALRDLFLYLVAKYNVDEVTNPRIKNELWKSIAREFHEVIDNVVTIKHEKFTKKWQNWKQYSKIKGKPHPLEDPSINLDFDIIREKIRKVKERAAIDTSFALFLNRESDESKLSNERPATSTDHDQRLMPGPSSIVNSSSLSNKQLEREVYMEALRCEQERFKYLVENGKLENEKLRREADFMDVQLQLAQADSALKRQECQEKGLILQ